MSWVSFLRVYSLSGATKDTPNQTIGKTGLLWYNLLRRVYPERLFSKSSAIKKHSMNEFLHSLHR